MTSKSDVLAIGTETSENLKPITHNRKAYLQWDFEEHLQKILLNGAKPLKSAPDDNAIERFGANEFKKNDHHYYEFGAESKRFAWLINGPTFEAKGVLRRVKDRISKDHWITDNVAKYKKHSRDFIKQTVSNALHEEQVEIYQYLCYLNTNFNKK
ncbi:uncharacterized protein LOC108096926 [Drosophila ficusphila]|uniref:uncharacterized protein LOC108096926 n=1 Tax=Drosophila ficusphila TaxID=30025 RepID=UPI0007E8493E|nr:uncharacterized protein LOC108096926 [Drosophila ficusphila]